MERCAQNWFLSYSVPEEDLPHHVRIRYWYLLRLWCLIRHGREPSCMARPKSLRDWLDARNRFRRTLFPPPPPRRAQPSNFAPHGISSPLATQDLTGTLQPETRMSVDAICIGHRSLGFWWPVILAPKVLKRKGSLKVIG